MENSYSQKERTAHRVPVHIVRRTSKGETRMRVVNAVSVTGEFTSRREKIQ